MLLLGDTAIHDIHGITDDEVRALQKETDSRWSQPKMLYFTILVCSLGAIEQGWAQTSMNGANLYFPKALGIDSGSSHDTLVIGLINSGIYFSTGFVWVPDLSYAKVIHANMSKTVEPGLLSLSTICLQGEVQY